MPYTSNAKLPKRILDAIPSEGGRTLWRTVFNDQLDRHKKEGIAFASAWAALEGAGYKRNKDGLYIKEAISKQAGNIRLNVGFTKQNEDKMLVAGWASVAKTGTSEVTDLQGDIVDIENLREAAHAFMQNSRVIKLMHDGEAIGHVVELVVVNDDSRQALKIEHENNGVWIVAKIVCPKAWQAIKSQQFKGFSIGGQGVRNNVN